MLLCWNLHIVFCFFFINCIVCFYRLAGSKTRWVLAPLLLIAVIFRAVRSSDSIENPDSPSQASDQQLLYITMVWWWKNNQVMVTKKSNQVRLICSSGLPAKRLGADFSSSRPISVSISEETTSGRSGTDSRRKSPKQWVLCRHS